jgi:hypothetical protein
MGSCVRAEVAAGPCRLAAQALAAAKKHKAVALQQQQQQQAGSSSSTTTTARATHPMFTPSCF